MSPRALPPGTTLGRYQVVSLLGQGSFGLTYLASDPASGLMVAIKEYLPAAYALRNPDHSVSPISDLEEDDFEFGMERFRADAQALQRTVHPSLVGVRDVFDANGTVCMVMSYEDGPSLAEALNREPTLTERELLTIAVSLIDACKTLHGAGLIHRDVKEAHIKLRHDRTPILIDIGAARVGLLRRRLAIGSGDPGRDPSKLDGSAGPWTDIHALAAMLFRVARRLGSICSPQVVDAMRAGISVQPADVAPLTSQWLERIDTLLKELPVPERPVAAVSPEESCAGPAPAVRAQDGGTSAAATDADPGASEIRARQDEEAPADTEKEEAASGLGARPFHTTSREHAESAEVPPSSCDGAISFDRNDAEGESDMGETSTPASQHTLEPAPVRPLDPRPQTVTTPTKPAATAEPEAALDLDRLTRRVAAAAVVAIVFGVVMWRLDARPPAPPSTTAARPAPPAAPAIDAPGGVPGTAHETVVATAPLPPTLEQPEVRGTPLPEAPMPTPASTTAPPPPDPPVNVEIDGLLAEAARDVAELRLTTPRGSNAVEKYEAVLALDPGNGAARQGLNAVSDRYVDLASTALARGQLAAARRYLELAQSIAPDNARAQALRRELDARQQQQPHRSAEETVAAEWRGGLYDRVQGFIERNQARPPRPPSRAEQIPDRLGGQR